MWNIAHNLGGFAAPIIAGGFAKAMGWKWGMWAPGIIGLVVGTLVLIFWCGAGAIGKEGVGGSRQSHGRVLLGGATLKQGGPSAKVASQPGASLLQVALIRPQPP